MFSQALPTFLYLPLLGLSAYVYILPVAQLNANRVSPHKKRGCTVRLYEAPRAVSSADGKKFRIFVRCIRANTVRPDANIIPDITTEGQGLARSCRAECSGLSLASRLVALRAAVP